MSHSCQAIFPIFLAEFCPLSKNSPCQVLHPRRNSLRESFKRLISLGLIQSLLSVASYLSVPGFINYSEGQRLFQVLLFFTLSLTPGTGTAITTCQGCHYLLFISFSHAPVLLRYKWHTTLYKFKVYNLMIWDLSLSLSLSEGNGNPFQYSCLGNARGAWRAIVHGLQRVGHDSVTDHTYIAEWSPQ